MHVRLACPPDYRPRVEDRVGAEILADRHGGSVSLVADPAEAVAGADAVYTAPWPEPVRSGRGAARMRAYHVDGAVMRLARPNAVFMHCLPAHRGEEVQASVIDAVCMRDGRSSSRTPNVGSCTTGRAPAPSEPMAIRTVPVAPKSRVHRRATTSASLRGEPTVRSSPCQRAIDKLREAWRRAAIPAA